MGIYDSNLMNPFMFEDSRDEEIRRLNAKIYRLQCEIVEQRNKVDLPERYIINDGATILFWKKGKKTIVKRAEDDEFNPRLAFLTAFFQHYCGMSKNKANKYLANLEVEKKPEVEKEETVEKPKRGRPKKLRVGDRVVHGRFGKGKIVEDDNSRDLRYLVEFDEKRKFLHDGGPFASKKRKDGHCYWCCKEELTREDK